MIGVTMEAAKGMFFDPSTFDDPLAKAKQKILNRFGATVRATAKNSIKQGAEGQHAAAGQPPLSHNGTTRYKDWIFYFWDKTLDEVIVGAILLPRKDHTIVPNALEQGGQVEHTKFVGATRQTVITNQAARPHMKPAYDKTVEKLLPSLIENSIVKG